MAEPTRFPPAVETLLSAERLPDLGRGNPQSSRRAELAGLTPEQLLAPGPVRDVDMARAVLAGLWLHFDFLDESHAISQSIETPTGSYWHGIMHRREGDFENAKYWFRRVESHKVFPAVCAEAQALAARSPDAPSARWLAEQTAWDPFHFVDACRAATRGGTTAEIELLRRLHLSEWRYLLEYCVERA
jgi:hypothetical protein